MGYKKQAALKKELLNTYFCLAVNLDEKQNLQDAVSRAGLDIERAQKILNNDKFSAEVRQEEAVYTSAGIHSVPSIILNDQYLMQGAQPHITFINAFEQLINSAQLS